MRAPRPPLGIVLIGVIASIAACAGPPSAPSPPPAEAHTTFAPIELDMKGEPDWMAAGFGSVWVKRPEGVVSRIDAATATVTAEIEIDTTPSPQLCEGIGLGVDAIWTCAFHDLVRLDPATDAVVATIPAGKIPGQGRLVGAAGRIWVLAGEGDQLVGVAEADGSLSDPIALPVACNDLGAASDVVYVVCERANRVLRVDPARATVTADVPITKPSQVSAAASGIWVSADDRLLQLDPVSLATKRAVDGMGVGFLGGIFADDNGVWARRVNPFLTRIDATTGAQTRVISAPLDGGGDVLVDGSYLWVSDLEHRVVVRLEIPAGS